MTHGASAAKLQFYPHITGRVSMRGIAMRGPVYTASARIAPEGTDVAVRRNDRLRLRSGRGTANVSGYGSFVAAIALTAVLLALVQHALVTAILQAGIAPIGVAEAAAWAARLLLALLGMALFAVGPGTRRACQYHGAEHKAIACFEANRALTLENIRGMSRLHPRCGTNLFALFLLPDPGLLLIWNDRITYALPQKIAWMLLVGACAYAALRYAARHDTTFARILLIPGMLLQRLATAEPDDAQITIALQCLTSVLPKENISNER